MGSMSGGASQSSSETKDTALSLAQTEILKKREAQYQEYFFPELIKGLNDGNKTANTAMMSQMSSQINQQSGQIKNSFAQSMAQRGLAGSGVEAQGLSSIERARGGMFSDAFFKTQLAQQEQKNNMLQMGGALSPRPTTAAPMGQESQSSGWNAGGSIL